MDHRSRYRYHQVKARNQRSRVIVIRCTSRIRILMNLWVLLIALVLQRHEVSVDIEQFAPVLQPRQPELRPGLSDPT